LLFRQPRTHPSLTATWCAHAHNVTLLCVEPASNTCSQRNNCFFFPMGNPYDTVVLITWNNANLFYSLFVAVRFNIFPYTCMKYTYTERCQYHAFITS
jgi:hypothetical protein